MLVIYSAIATCNWCVNVTPSNFERGCDSNIMMVVVNQDEIVK
jgi:hypothetical protein